MSGGVHEPVRLLRPNVATRRRGRQAFPNRVVRKAMSAVSENPIGGYVGRPGVVAGVDGARRELVRLQIRLYRVAPDAAIRIAVLRNGADSVTTFYSRAV